MPGLLLPAAPAGTFPAIVFRPLTSKPLSSHLPRLPRQPISPSSTPSPVSSHSSIRAFLFSPPPFHLSLKSRLSTPFSRRISSSSQISPTFSPPNDDPDEAKLAKVARRLEASSRYFKRLGNLGLWGQLVFTVVSAVILSFSIVATGKITSPFNFYATAGGIAAAFISVFWSFGYLRIADKLRRAANEPSKAPPRTGVVKTLKNGVTLNLLGMGAAILGMQATVGLLVAKVLTSSPNPYYQGIPPGYSPVLALDVFLVQASANTILSHFLGLVFSLELLRSVTLPPSESTPVPKVA